MCVWRWIICLFIPALANAQTDNPYILNGDAIKEDCNCYTLTSDSYNTSGSVWNKNKIDLNESFDYKFNVFLGCNDDGADGMAFVLQPISTSIGSQGGGMGYNGVFPSLGILIDTWQNGENLDPSYDYIAIMRDGNIVHGPTDLAAPMPALISEGNIEDCNWHTFRITWDATTKIISTEFDGVPRVSATVDMVPDIFSGDPMVYWGFTSATGGGKNHQRVCTSLNPGFYFPEGQETCYPSPLRFIDSSNSFGTINQWYWNFGDGTTFEGQNPPIHVFPGPGNYDVTLSILGNNGCVSDTFLRKIVAGSEPVAAFKYMPLYVCKDMPTSFFDNSSVEFGTINKWKWSINGQNFQDSNPPPLILNSVKNKIELTVETVEGCVSNVFTDSIKIKSFPCPELYVPSAFTPNNDGKNDKFEFIAAGMSSIESFKIYNRFGQVIFSSTDPNNGWDGRFKGKDQPPGVYIWVIKAIDMNGQIHFNKGTLTLIR